MSINRKRYIVIFLVLVIALFFLACGGEKEVDMELIDGEVKLENFDKAEFYYIPTDDGLISEETAMETAEYLADQGFYDNDIFLNSKKITILHKNSNQAPQLKIPTVSSVQDNEELKKQMDKLSKDLMKVFEDVASYKYPITFHLTDENFSGWLVYWHNPNRQ
jgi:hypothetical protein